MKPEENARLSIDAQLTAAGWVVVDRDEFTPNLGAAAIREALMTGQREADYLLLLHGKAVGIVEAKRADVKLDRADFREQALGYARDLPHDQPSWRKVLPLVYLANGKDILLCSEPQRPDAPFTAQPRFKHPYEVQAQLPEAQVLNNEFQLLPPLASHSLRACQVQAIENFEAGLKAGQRRALIVLATGAGKTITACTLVHRLLSFTRSIRSVLFLVDRTNLGAAALRTFQSYEVQGDYPFGTNYGVELLTSAARLAGSNIAVHISTIQRLYSILGGTDTPPDDDDFTASDIPMPLPEHKELAPHAFDLIIIDECHRSIYSRWGRVLAYFSEHALLVGLTATPIPESLAFFEHNVVVNYSLEQSIADGINVPPIVYRIKTELSEEGGEIQPGEALEVTSHYTGRTQNKTATTAQAFAPSDLGRAIMAPDQIRTILSEYRDVVFTKLYPERAANFDYLPKTLIFARSEEHARQIVAIAHEVFARPASDHHFVQAITYSAADSNALIRSFRNDKDFRIAVTVTLVATGTDVPALEVLLFLTDVRSQVLYQQMKGRGVRTISDDHLREVTPNAQHKDHFVLVDAVGVTEHEKGLPCLSSSTPLTLSLERLLEELARGVVSDDNMLLLAQKLTTLAQRGDPDELIALQHIAPALDLLALADSIRRGCAPELYEEVKGFPPYRDSNEPNRERKAVLAPLLNDVPARRKLVEIARGYLKVLPQQRDVLLYSDFSFESAAAQVESFELALNELAQENEVLQGIRTNDIEAQVLSAETLEELQTALTNKLPEFTVPSIWGCYELLDRAQREPAASNAAPVPPRVVPLNRSNEDECYAATNFLQLTRFAWHNCSTLVSLANHQHQARLFNLWCGQTQNDLPMTPEYQELYRHLANYIALNGAISDVGTLYELDAGLCQDLRAHFGAASQEPLDSLNRFLLLRA